VPDACQKASVSRTVFRRLVLTILMVRRRAVFPHQRTEGPCGRLVTIARRVQVEHDRPRARMPHPGHQLPERRTRWHGEGVPRVP